jgi:hypothetical protein
MRFRRFIVVWKARSGRQRSTVVVAPSHEHARKALPETVARRQIRIVPYSATAARALGGVRPHRLHTADFAVGRKIDAVAPGLSFQRGGARCTTGAGSIRSMVPGQTIPFSVAREVFMSTVAEHGATGATVLPAWGLWPGGREPSFVGQVSWTPRHGRGSVSTDARAFQSSMVAACQALACNFSQAEVVARIRRPGKAPLFLRCSPTGAPAPPMRY